MGFFQTFWTWLHAQLATYIGNNTARVATALEPAIVAMGTIYVMVWGYLCLSGRLEEPFVAGLKRIMTLAVVFGVTLHLWLYNSLIVSTFYDAPAQFAAVIVGAPDPVATIDTIWDRGGAVAGYLWNKGMLMFGISFLVTGAVIWVLVGLLCVYTMFLFSLSSIALAILLAIGPLFIPMLLFDGTKRFFETWLAQLANYALITILTILTATLLLQIVERYAAQTAARGSSLFTVDTLDLMLVCVLVFLFMRQVMPIAAGLAGGVALNTFGSVSRFIELGKRTTVGTGKLVASRLARKREE